MKQKVVIRRLGLRHYLPVWRRMQEFTLSRDATTGDEIWILQHHSVFTQGTSCHDQPRPGSSKIPLVHSDRGGQITYHGPGQLVAYLLLDIKRRQQGPKSLVHQVEQVIIDLLHSYSVAASRHPGAPGVYVKRAKIAALGLRIRRGCSYHGLSLNVEMDLAPYQLIDPCGYRDMAVTQLSAQNSSVDISDVEDRLSAQLLSQFG